MKHNKSVRITVIVIGSLSVVAGVVLAFTKGEFYESLSAIVLGVSMIGSAMLYDFTHPIDDQSITDL